MGQDRDGWRRCQGWPASLARRDLGVARARIRRGRREDEPRRAGTASEEAAAAQAGCGLAGGTAVDDRRSRAPHHRGVAAVTAIGEKAWGRKRIADRPRGEEDWGDRAMAGVSPGEARAEPSRERGRDAGAGCAGWLRDGHRACVARRSGGCRSGRKNACSPPTRNVRCETSSGTATARDWFPLVLQPRLYRRILFSVEQLRLWATSGRRSKLRWGLPYQVGGLVPHPADLTAKTRCHCARGIGK
jgi:hypothetical protein